MTDQNRPIIIGRIVALFGVKGWVKVRSYTDPPANLLNYQPWLLITPNGEIAEQILIAGYTHGKGIVAQLAGCTAPEHALRWVGRDIAVPRSALPPPEEGEYYWADLVGLAVITVTGINLGRIASLLETGANQVLVVTGERDLLIPYLPDQVVKQVDFTAQRLIVDWDPDF